MADTKPISVNASAIGAMAAALARDVLKVAGTGLVSRGILNQDGVDQAAGLVVALAPIVYSQLRTFWNHRKLVRMATILPDRIAEVKS